jgi:UDP-N-acetylmuramoyl-tripeptide--D-alanyl-D-alanine ligase
MADGGPWRILRFGVSTSASLRASNVSALWPQRLCFEIEHAGRTIPVRTQFVGEHWLPSVLGPIAVAHALGVPLDAAARAVAAVPPYPGRMQPVRLPNGAVFLRDDYNGSLDTLEAAFDVFRGAKATRRILVISDIADFGGHIRKRMAYLGQKAGEACDLLVLIGDYPDRAVKRAFVSGLTEERTRRFFSLEQAAKFLRAELRDGDLVLLKGRTTDHVSRIFFAQLGTVSCWKAYCPKTMLCDECWELGPHSR